MKFATAVDIPVLVETDLEFTVDGYYRADPQTRAGFNHIHVHAPAGIFIDDSDKRPAADVFAYGDCTCVGIINHIVSTCNLNSYVHTAGSECGSEYRLVNVIRVCSIYGRSGVGFRAAYGLAPGVVLAEFELVGIGQGETAVGPDTAFFLGEVKVRIPGCSIYGSDD